MGNNNYEFSEAFNFVIFLLLFSLNSHHCHDSSHVGLVVVCRRFFFILCEYQWIWCVCSVYALRSRSWIFRFVFVAGILKCLFLEFISLLKRSQCTLLFFRFASLLLLAESKFNQNDAWAYHFCCCGGFRFDFDILEISTKPKMAKEIFERKWRKKLSLP